MARKPPPPSYANMALGPATAPAAPIQAPEPANSHPAATRRPAGRTLKEASAHLMLYVHPDASKALKRYALDQNTKVHELLLEAVEDWFRRHGLRETVRAETGRNTGISESGAGTAD